MSVFADISLLPADIGEADSYKDTVQGDDQRPAKKPSPGAIMFQRKPTVQAYSQLYSTELPKLDDTDRSEVSR